MGFNIYGCPHTKDTNVILLENKTYLGIWINKLNFENYTNSIFYIDLEINNNSEYSYINNELKVLEYYIKWIENVFEFRKISKHEIESYKKHIEKEDVIFNNRRLVNFVDEFKGSKRDISVINKLEYVTIPIDKTTEEERVYLLCLMYLDILKIKYFLKTKLLEFAPIPNQLEAVKPDEVLKNEFDNIFKNDIGFTIFNKMFELYKVETNHLANFSFLFFVMEKDFLVCGQTDFKEFLRNEKYNIEIEKIDSRQWNLNMNKNKKSKLFNSIKERYQSNTIKAQ
jgi:hypothetical protein